MFFVIYWTKVEKTNVACCGTSLMVKLEMRVLHPACIRVEKSMLCKKWTKILT